MNLSSLYKNNQIFYTIMIIAALAILSFIFVESDTTYVSSLILEAETRVFGNEVQQKNF